MFKILIYIPYFGSRPKQVKDAAHQEEVVCVLTNTLETANVSEREREILTINYCSFLSYMLFIHLFLSMF